MSHYTKIPGVPDRDDVKDGMAFYERTGPPGTTCGTCVHRGYYRTRDVWNKKTGQWVPSSVKRGGCAIFKAMTGRHGPAVKTDYRSCKYYEAAPK